MDLPVSLDPRYSHYYNTSDSMIIDGHAHACGDYLTLETIEQKLSMAGCNAVVLTPGEYGSKSTYTLPERAKKSPLKDVVSFNNKLTRIVIAITRKVLDVPMGNNYVYELHRQMPDKVFQCYWITKENIEQLNTDYQQMKFVMVKMHQCWERFSFEDDYFLEAAAWAESHQIPMFLHVYNQQQMQLLIAYLHEHPRLNVIVGHLYLAEMFFDVSEEVLRHVWFDLSNCYFVSQERILKALAHFGSNHLLMGSDTPYGKKSLETTICRLQELDIPDNAKQNILGNNLRCLCNLSSNNKV